MFPDVCQSLVCKSDLASEAIGKFLHPQPGLVYIQLEGRRNIGGQFVIAPGGLVYIQLEGRRNAISNGAISGNSLVVAPPPSFIKLSPLGRTIRS